MNAAYAHLLLCHLPTLGVLFALALLVGAAVRRDRSLRMAALVAFVIAAASAAPTFLTGDGARAVVELVPGSSDALVAAHREDAWLALLATVALGTASLVALFRSRQGGDPGRWLSAVVWLLAVLAFASLVWTSARGGRIRHGEVARGVTGGPVPRSAACAMTTHLA